MKKLDDSNRLKLGGVLQAQDLDIRLKDLDQFNVFPKFDWLSLVWNDVSFAQIAKIFGLWDIYDQHGFVNAFNSIYCRSNLFEYSEFSFNGFRVVVIGEPYQIRDQGFVNFYDKKLKWIKTDISGAGLDYIRNKGFDIDLMIFGLRNASCKVCEVPESPFHVTRVDIAFDLINFMPEFLDESVKLCREYGNCNSVRVRGTGNTKKPISWSFREGNQKTLYLGSSGSDKLCRIYDKKLQFDQDPKKWISCPYVKIKGCPPGTFLNEYSDDVLKNAERENPQSWIRIEAQLRNDPANMMVDSENDFLKIFKWIYDQFGILDDPKSKTCTLWDSMFDWGKIPSIIQNANCVELPPDYIKRSERYIFGNGLSLLLIQMSKLGPSAFIQYTNFLLKQLQLSSESSDSRRWNRILGKYWASFDFKDQQSFRRDDSGIFQLRWRSYDIVNALNDQSFFDALDEAGYCLINRCNGNVVVHESKNEKFNLEVI